MPTRKTKNSQVDRWVRLSDQIKKEVPQVSSWLFSTTDFVEVRFKARDDGTVLGIAKGYDSSGGPIVCFGVGYDVVLALMALDATIAGGHWRVDKPWKPVEGK